MSVQEQVARIVMAMPDEQAKALLSILGQTASETTAARYADRTLGSYPTLRDLLENDSLVTPTERGRNADAYMEEIRGNDRVS